MSANVSNHAISRNWFVDPTTYRRDDTKKPEHIPIQKITCDQYNIGDVLKDRINHTHIPLAVGVVMSGSRVDLTLTTSSPKDLDNKTRFHPRQTCFQIDTEKAMGINPPDDKPSHLFRKNYMVLQQIISLITETADKLGNALKELPFTFTISGFQLPDIKRMKDLTDIRKFGMPRNQVGWVCVPNPRPGNYEGYHPAIFNFTRFLQEAVKSSQMGLSIQMEKDPEPYIVKQAAEEFGNVKARFEIINDGILCARAIASDYDFLNKGKGQNKGLNILHTVVGTGTNILICKGYLPSNSESHSQGKFTEETNTEWGHHKLTTEQAKFDRQYWPLEKFRQPQYNGHGKLPYTHEETFGGGNDSNAGNNRIRGLKGQVKYIAKLVKSDDDKELQAIVDVFKQVDDHFTNMTIKDLKESKLLKKDILPDEHALSKEDISDELDSEKPETEKEGRLLKSVNDHAIAGSNDYDPLAEALVTTFMKRVAEYWIALCPQKLKDAHVISLNGSNGCGILSKVDIARKVFENTLKDHTRKDVKFLLFAGEHDMDGHCEYERQQAIDILRSSKDIRSRLKILAKTANAKVIVV